MKWADIKNKYKNQWVLIEVEKVDENFNSLEGEVLAHSKDKDEIYQKLLQIRPEEFSIEYTGEIPEDLAVVMVISGESLYWCCKSRVCCSFKASKGEAVRFYRNHLATQKVQHNRLSYWVNNSTTFLQANNVSHSESKEASHII